MSQARRISLNTGALVLSSGSKMVFSFAFVVVAARILGVSGFGQYELAVHYFELILSLVATGLAILITREIAKDKDRVNEYLSAALILSGILVVLGIALLQLLPLAFDYAPETDAAIRLIALALLPGALAQLLEATFVAFEVAHIVTLGTVVEGIVRVATGIVLLLLGHGILSLVLVLLLSRACLLTFYLLVLRRYVPRLAWSLDWSQFVRMVREWKTFALENWLSNISSSAGIIILSAVHGEFAVGLYFAAQKLLRLGIVVAKSYTDAVFPFMSRLSRDSREALHRLSMDSVRFMLVFVLPVIVTLCVFADRVIDLLYSTEYEGSIQILRVLIWILLLRFLNPFLSHVLFARGEQSRSLQVAAVKLGVVLVASVLLIPPLGGVGAASASLLASSCATLFYFIFVLRGREARDLISTLGRTLLPALALAAILVVWRDAQLFLLLGLGSVVYFGLSIALRGLSMNDLRLLQRL